MGRRCSRLGNGAVLLRVACVRRVCCRVPIVRLVVGSQSTSCQSVLWLSLVACLAALRALRMASASPSVGAIIGFLVGSTLSGVKSLPRVGTAVCCASPGCVGAVVCFGLAGFRSVPQPTQWARFRCGQGADTYRDTAMSFALPVRLNANCEELHTGQCRVPSGSIRICFIAGA